MPEANGTEAEWFERDAPFRLVSASGVMAGAMSLNRLPLAQLEAQADEVLSPLEAARLTDRLAPRRRHSFLAGRRAAKQALRHLLPSAAARDFHVLPGVLEQPVVSGPGVSNLQVTLSHTGTLAVALAHPEACPMGVDLEQLSPEHRPVLREQAGAREQALAMTALDLDEDRRLLLLWCLKEALSKALRCGLTVPFDLLEVATLDPAPSGARARFSNFGQYEGFAFCRGNLCLAAVLPHTVRWLGANGTEPVTTLAAWLGATAPAT
ncbi:4'-phosphopantetheinyl transferase family protein [Xanthobacter agilis]|uniref:4'-phosphopantetheinyl transferase family protein n=1 Tax=Xanthobacter agilis TaxID=47492 RepID=UPI00372825D4